jgi:hypothetical protein
MCVLSAELASISATDGSQAPDHPPTIIAGPLIFLWVIRIFAAAQGAR